MAVLASSGAVVAGLLAAVAPPAVAATTNPAPAAGSRASATRLSFPVSGTAGLSVDVGSGNALVTDQLLTLPGAVADVPITLSYNSSVFGSSIKSIVTNETGSGWAITGFDQRVVTNADSSVTYYGPGGLTGVFVKTSTGFTAPAQFQADLSGSASAGYTLTDHDSQEKLTFNSSGRLTTDADRNGNTTTYGYDGYGYPSSIVSSRGTTATKTVTVAISNGRITGLTQTSGSSVRTVTLGYSTAGHLASVTDAEGKVTSFDATPEGSSSGPDTGEVLRIVSPASKPITYLTFTGSGPKKVASVSQTNPSSDGGAGESVTRLTYPTSTQTLVADPTTSQGSSVASVPHTTYDLDSASSQLVATATDPDGHARSATYTSLGSIASSTPAAGGSTSFTYGANAGESLTKVGFPGGATDTASYTNSGANAYLPSSSTNSAGNSLQYTYNTAGNPTTSQHGAAGPPAKVTYNTNGTAATSASPGAAAGVTTNYAYDANANLQTITAPSGTSLGVRTYTWDAFGRLATATTGAGSTLTYGYDKQDRITSVAYSDGTATVSYQYDPTGHVTQRSDASGVTTYTYDDLGHLLSVHNSASGKTVTYTYDLAGALATSVDDAGTVTYGYDAAHQLTSMTYPISGTTKTALFANDANGRRTDVWLKSNADHSVWDAHEHYTYDNSGRTKTVLGENGPATGPTTTVNETLCYAANSTAPACSTAAADDRNQIQWTRDTVSGETNTYTYNSDDRLTKDVVTGGSNPRTYTFGYDNAGNRTSSAVTGSSPTSQSLAFNNANQISTSGYTYDGAGNLTASPTRNATFNAAGQQTSSTIGANTATYTYAGTNNNELLSEVVPGDRTYSLSYGRPDRNGVPVIDSVTASGVGTGYVFTDPDGQPIILSVSSGNAVLYVYDGIHNPVILSANGATSQAFAYDPYGAQTKIGGTGSASSTQNPYAFQAGIRDRFTNEVKFGQRYYAPTTGTWTQQDTLNAPLDPKNANRYAYAGDDPINNADPAGRNIFGDIVGATTGFVAGTAAFFLSGGNPIVAGGAAGAVGGYFGTLANGGSQGDALGSAVAYGALGAAGGAAGGAYFGGE